MDHVLHDIQETQRRMLNRLNNIERVLKKDLDILAAYDLLDDRGCDRERFSVAHTPERIASEYTAHYIINRDRRWVVHGSGMSEAQAILDLVHKIDLYFSDRVNEALAELDRRGLRDKLHRGVTQTDGGEHFVIVSVGGPKFRGYNQAEALHDLLDHLQKEDGEPT